MSKHDSPTNELPRGPLVLLLALGVAESLLAIFQWAELLILRRGGGTLCSINDIFNCETVWNSHAASVVHAALGMPVAALGLVWGASVAFLSAMLLVRRGKAQARLLPAVGPALRLLSAAGALAVVGFGGVSLAGRTLCPTCLVTYVLVLAFAGVALFRLPGPTFPSEEQLPRALLWTLAPVLVSYVLLLVPGVLTPRAEEQSAEALRPLAGPIVLGGPATTQGGDPLSLWLSSISPPQAQALSDTLEAYRHGMTATSLPPRVLKGPARAPVRIVEFTDIRCSHCRALVENLAAMEKALPPGTFAVDARHFPLDSECNPVATNSDKTGVRCLGARAQICLEGARDYWELRDRLFAEQESLTPGRILEIASSGSVKRPQLEECVKSQETERKLQDDIRFAAQLNPQGTPIVIVNGKEASPMPGLLLALALSGGNPDAPAFARLPPPVRGGARGE